MPPPPWHGCPESPVLGVSGQDQLAANAPSLLRGWPCLGFQQHDLGFLGIQGGGGGWHTAWLGSQWSREEGAAAWLQTPRELPAAPGGARLPHLIARASELSRRGPWLPPHSSSLNSLQTGPSPARGARLSSWDAGPKQLPTCLPLWPHCPRSRP